MPIGSLFVNPRWTALSGGSVVPSARLYFYRTGTTTDQNTFSDSDLGTLNDNPMIADSNGVFGKIYLDPSTGYDYRVRLATSADVTIWQEDDVIAEINDAAKLAEDTFTGTLTGYASGPTPTVRYRVVRDEQAVGKVATLICAAGSTGTSNATSLTMTGLPTAVQPTTTAIVPCLLTDNGSNYPAFASIASSTITFSIDSPLSATGFTNSGTKGLPVGWTITYPL